jgi:tripartite-type tricarboxylate transporter receptor subunit TctC
LHNSPGRGGIDGAVGSADIAEHLEEPVEYIVPWPPDDLEDILTRMFADKFQETSGVPAAVVNKPGGGGPFPSAVDVTDAPYDEWAGLADYAKMHEVSLGLFGDSLTPTRVTFAAAKEGGYEVSSNAAFDALDRHNLASCDAEVINTTLQQIMPCLAEIKIRASIGSERIGVTTDVPAMQEIYPNLGLALWNGLFVTKGVQQDARDKIISVAKKVMSTPEAAQLSADTGAQIYLIDTEASAAQIEADTKMMALISGKLI